MSKQRREPGVHTLHDTTKGIKNSLGCKVLRGDQVNEVLLTFFLLGMVLAAGPSIGELAISDDAPSAGYYKRRGRTLLERRRATIKLSVCMFRLPLNPFGSPTLCCVSRVDDATPRDWANLGTIKARAETTAARELPRGSKRAADLPQRDKYMMKLKNLNSQARYYVLSR